MRRAGWCWLLSLCCTVAMLGSSCISKKATTYFNNLPDSSRIQLAAIKPPQPVIQISDVLQIQLSGENEKTIQYITQHFTGGNQNGSLEAIVDVNGNIELPQIGKIQVAGLTRESFKDTITKAYREFLVNPIVNVKFGNFRFTVLGEVNGPGNYNVPYEKISIFEAIAEAGDMNTFAERDKVNIIRDINGKREIRRVNLNDKGILDSSDYYLNRYDILYVEAKPLKSVNENLQRTLIYFSFITSTLALITLIAN